jgi:hypothetical protein
MSQGRKGRDNERQNHNDSEKKDDSETEMMEGRGMGTWITREILMPLTNTAAILAFLPKSSSHLTQDVLVFEAPGGHWGGKSKLHIV